MGVGGKAALNRFQYGAYSALFVYAVRTRTFRKKKYIYQVPGYMLLLWYTRVIAIMVTRIFSASRTEIRQNDDMHCSARAIRLIMERLPWRPQIKPGSAAAWGLLRAKKNSNRCHFLKKVAFYQRMSCAVPQGGLRICLSTQRRAQRAEKKSLGPRSSLH